MTEHAFDAGDRRGVLGRRRLFGGAAGLVGAHLVGCVSAPEVHNVGGFATRLDGEGKGDPPPPDDVFWLSIAHARIPAKNRRGRPWDETGGPPTPFVVLELDGKRVLQTPDLGATLDATWEPGLASSNFRLARGAQLQVTIFDRGALNDRPLGQGKLPVPDETDLSRGHLEVDIGQVGSPGEVRIDIAPAHALRGLGFDFEVFGTTPKVTRVLELSPAGRAGFEVEDEILAIDGVQLRGLEGRQIRSALNGIGRHPAQILVKHATGTTETFAIAEGPCYPLFDELGLIA